MQGIQRLFSQDTPDTWLFSGTREDSAVAPIVLLQYATRQSAADDPPPARPSTARPRRPPVARTAMACVTATHRTDARVSTFFSGDWSLIRSYQALIKLRYIAYDVVCCPLYSLLVLFTPHRITHSPRMWPQSLDDHRQPRGRCPRLASRCGGVVFASALAA